MLKKLTGLVMALVLAIGASVSAPEPAEARGGRVAAGIAAGIIGLGILGAMSSARARDSYYYRSHEECYPGPERCGWVDQHCFENSWGDRVCRGGRWSCWRRTVCE